MKKYIIIICILIFSFIFTLYINFIGGFYINFDHKVESFTSNDETSIYVHGKKFNIRGVNMGSGIPGHFATDYAISKETYKRWFKSISEMGANTIRIYTILSPNFYEAFYEFNKENDKPLYLIHGVWVDDYILNSKVDAYAPDFKDKFLKDTKTMIDVIHGKKYIPINDSYSNGLYTKDISEYVLGYIIGVEWDDSTVAYTNHTHKKGSYDGKYLHTKKDTPAFENMLAYIADKAISYETDKYNHQRLFAFSNWPTTDPFDYSAKVTEIFKKFAKLDVENIVFNKNFEGGTFASYHVYPYYPDYLNYEPNKNKYKDKNGKLNTYKAYLKKLNTYHKIPVIISEFGVSTGRGMAQVDENTGYNQGNMDEEKQGEALVSMYKSIMDSGSAGGIAFTWQDEWFKRTWNTMQNVDLNFTPYWSDVQTNEQYFGLMSFDPGKSQSKVYIDGDISEWNKKDIVYSNSKNQLSFKYDEKYLYFMVHTAKLDLNKNSLYIPIDLTPNSGSKTNNITKTKYDRNIDFLIKISDKKNSRVYVHEYYDSLLAVHSENIFGKNIYYDPPKKDSTKFNKIELILKYNADKKKDFKGTYETGKLKYGNGNPDNKDFNSLADYTVKDNNIEIRIPWGLLNFSNPSKMHIHDDYYKKFGIENMKVDKMYIGVNNDRDESIKLNEVELKPWGTNVSYHERLKKSYYMLKEYWSAGE